MNSCKTRVRESSYRFMHGLTNSKNQTDSLCAIGAQHSCDRPSPATQILSVPCSMNKLLMAFTMPYLCKHRQTSTGTKTDVSGVSQLPGTCSHISDAIDELLPATIGVRGVSVKICSHMLRRPQDSAMTQAIVRSNPIWRPQLSPAVSMKSYVASMWVAAQEASTLSLHCSTAWREMPGRLARVCPMTRCGLMSSCRADRISCASCGAFMHRQHWSSRQGFLMPR